MKNFFRKKWVKIIFIFLGVVIFLILLWYFFGDNLFLSLLKSNSTESPCHEDCMAQRAMIEAGLIYLAENRPWTINKIKSEILNQKQPGKYRALVLEVYRQILGEGASFPKEILNLLNDSKTSSEVKESIISLSSDLEPTQEMIEQWKKIAEDENQGVEARIAAIRKIGGTKKEEYAEFLLDLFINSNNKEIKFFTIGGVRSVLKDKKITQSLIEKLKNILSDSNIHSAWKEDILSIFAFSQDKVFAKNLIIGVYSNSKEYGKFLRYRAAELLDCLETKCFEKGVFDYKTIIYSRPEISDKEWEDYNKSLPF